MLVPCGCKRQDTGEVEYRNVLGTENPADLMAKCLARSAMDECMAGVGQERVTGRAKVGLEVQGTGNKATETRVAKCHEVEDNWMEEPGWTWHGVRGG